MKNNKIILLVCIALSIFGCKKGIEPEIIEEENFIHITANFENESTKTYTSDGITPLWTSNDQIALLYSSTTSESKTQYTIVLDKTSALAQGEIGGTIINDGKGFTCDIPALKQGEVCHAVYPSTCLDSNNPWDATNGLAIKLPGSVRGTFGEANICASELNSDKLIFKNVASIIKITGKDDLIKYIRIQAGATNPTYVKFSGSAITTTKNGNDGTILIAPIGEGVTAPYYAPISLGDAFAGDLAEYLDYSGATTLGKKTITSSKNFERNKIYNIGYANITGSLSGEFSISGNKSVIFSKGNILYNNGTWKFEDNQYDYHTWENNGNITGLFYFASNPNEARQAQTPSTARTSIFTGNDIGIPGGWRTLTPSEMSYIINTRSAGSRFALATVCGKKGLLIFPDQFQIPSGVTINGINDANNSFSVNTYDNDKWHKLENNGAVFMPACGQRLYASGNVYLYSQDSYGFYHVDNSSYSQFCFNENSDANNWLWASFSNAGGIRMAREIN